MDKKRLSRREKIRRARRKQILMRSGIFMVMTLAAAGVLWAGFQYINKPKVVDGSEKMITEVNAAPNSDEQQVEGAGYSLEDTATLVKTQGAQELKYPVPGWQINDKGWWYQENKNEYYANGWKTVKGLRYYFDESGYMATGWYVIDGKDYYFDDSGQIDTTKEPKLLALTFDDGPSQYTEHLLEVLEKYNSKATFFMVGRQLEQYADTVKKMHAAGMELGNHTWDHTYLNKSDSATMYQKFDMADAKLKELVGVESSVYRSPGGVENDTYRAGVAKPLIMWSVDTQDWKTLNVQSNIDAVIDKVEDGDIVLMHDLHKTTVESCDTIIPQLRKNGFKLVTVSELAQARGITLEKGVDYYKIKQKKVETQSEDSKTE